MLWNHICCTKNLFTAWRTFKRGKQYKHDVMEFERHLEDNIFQLQAQLLEGRYLHDAYTPFTIFDPKRRQIHKACVKDRLVHQAVVQAIEPCFESRFIFDSYSCRIGKGTHRAVRRLRKFVNTLGANHTKTVYVLKCDVKQFFASVDHNTLLQLLQRRISNNNAMYLIAKIIDSFHTDSGKGLPLGNVTSQLFANIYLHELDYFIKHHLQEKYYIRYCDDFIIAHQDRKHLTLLIPLIDKFLQSKLNIHLHPNKTVIRTPAQGIDFLGYCILEYATVVKTDTKKRALKRVTKKNGSSYLGLCQHADTFELQQTLKNLIWYRT